MYMWYWFDELGKFWKVINIDNSPFWGKLTLILDKLINSSDASKKSEYRDYLLKIINWYYDDKNIGLLEERLIDNSWLSI